MLGFVDTSIDGVAMIREASLVVQVENGRACWGVAQSLPVDGKSIFGSKGEEVVQVGTAKAVFEVLQYQMDISCEQ